MTKKEKNINNMGIYLLSLSVITLWIMLAFYFSSKDSKTSSNNVSLYRLQILSEYEKINLSDKEKSKIYNYVKDINYSEENKADCSVLGKYKIKVDKKEIIFDEECLAIVNIKNDKKEYYANIPEELRMFAKELTKEKK